MAIIANDINKFLEALHSSETMSVIAVTGGGHEAITHLLGKSGASRTVLEALIPYSSNSLVEFINEKPSKYVCTETALLMAHKAYIRAVELKDVGTPVVGLACTATTTTDRAKKGAHSCHIAAWTPTKRTSYSLEFIKNLRNRTEEEDVISKLILNALADHSNVDLNLPITLKDQESIQVQEIMYEDPIHALFNNQIETVIVRSQNQLIADESFNGGILSGSFNPIHDGHHRLASVASSILNSEIALELSITNVDKPPLEQLEVRKRVSQLSEKWPIIISKAPTFLQKSRLFPGCTFVIGWDTATRLLDPKYYNGEQLNMITALKEIQNHGCRFFVAGRLDHDIFKTQSDLHIPEILVDMFEPINEKLFRHDLTSTELRQTQNKKEF